LTAHDDGVARLLDRVFTTFTDSGVAWALLRGRSELHTGRDTDLLVSAAHLPVAQEAIFQLGGAPLPQRRYPWHHMYVIDIPGSGPNLKLDIVTQLVYDRELQIASGLEQGCLERRVSDGALFLLSPTDAFWTILLHCLLDKQRVKPDRADELLARVADLDRPSPGEEFFAGLCPAGWSPDRALDCVVGGDWTALGHLGSQVLAERRAEVSVGHSPEGPGPGPARRKRTLVDKIVRRASDAATGAAYRKVWRAAGLGATPHVVDLVEETGVDVTVTELRRRPGRCDVSLVVDDAHLPRLMPVMARAYRSQNGTWRRLSRVGLESVRLVPASEAPGTRSPDDRPGDATMSFPGRRHGRLAL
jgi:hypothetical protein